MTGRAAAVSPTAIRPASPAVTGTGAATCMWPVAVADRGAAADVGARWVLDPIDDLANRYHGRLGWHRPEPAPPVAGIPPLFAWPDAAAIL